MEHRQEGMKRKLDLVDFSDLCSKIDKSTKKGPRAPWTSQDMVSAMLLVKQGMSITKAAQSLNIPRTTLRDRVTGKVKNAIKVGSQTMLTNQDEKALVSYYKEMQKQGYGKIKEMIMHMAGKLAIKNGYNANDVFPNETWWQLLCVRNNLPPLIETSHEMYETSKLQLNEAALNNCYEQLFDALASNKHGINFLDHPELIYVCNENEFNIDQMNNVFGSNLHQDVNQDENDNQHIDVKVSEIHVPCTADRLSRSSKSGSCSVITCASAIGHSLPPMFIHTKSGTDVQINAPEGIFEKVSYNRLDQDFFLIWFHEVFLKNTSRSSPMVLFYDGANCFVTKEILLAATMNDVVMLCIPATLTRVLQPLDLALQGYFHESWSNFDLPLLGISSVSHSNFSQMFLAMLNSTVPSSIIVERFRRVGIYPFSRQNTSVLCLDDVNGTENVKNDESNNAKKEVNNMQQVSEDLSMYSKVNYVDRSIDNNQNFMRCTGIINRPTMSNLSQSINESPVVTQIIAEDDVYVNDVSDGYHEALSADEASSSDEGNTRGISTNNTSVISPNIALSKLHGENHSPYLRSPTIPHHNHKSLARRKHSSCISQVNPSQAAHRDLVLSPNMYRATRDSPRTFVPSHSTPLMPPQTQWSRVQPSRSLALSSLDAFEALLDNQKLSRFRKSFDNSLENTVDLDPLYPIWKSLRLKCTAFFTTQSKPSVSSQEYTASSDEHETVLFPASNRNSTQSNCACSNSNDYRTIVTPAGNVSVNRNATVIVIMPEVASKTANVSQNSSEEVSASVHDNVASKNA